MNDMPEDISEEEVDSIEEDDGEVVESSDEPTSSSTPATPAPTASKAVIVVDDPYEWDKCQITLTITYLPDDGNDQGRMVIFSGRTHMDTPVFHYFREGEVADGTAMLSVLGDIQQELMASLEARGIAHSKVKAKETADLESATAKAKVQASLSKPYAQPQIPQELLNNQDAMNEMNTSSLALRMLQDLVRSGNRDFSTYRRTWKDQPVLELMAVGLLKVQEDKITVTDKGKAMYDQAMAWKPKVKAVQKENTKPPQATQASLF